MKFSYVFWKLLKFDSMCSVYAVLKKLRIFNKLKMRLYEKLKGDAGEVSKIIEEYQYKNKKRRGNKNESNS